MTHRDLITFKKFKELGFRDIELKYIPEIKLNRITCKISQKVGRGTYDIPIECFVNPAPRIIIARHLLFQAAIEALEDFNSKDHKEKVTYLEELGIK